jgi:hypothetical protein
MWRAEESRHAIQPTDFNSRRHRRHGGASIAPQKLPDLMDLVAAGYVEADEDLYKLTTEGQDYLAERGVGANAS